MFGTEGDGEENGNGLSAVCSGLLCLVPLQLKDWVFIWLLGHVVGHPKKTNRKFLLIGHTLHRHYKIRIERGCSIWIRRIFESFGKETDCFYDCLFV